MGEGFGGKNTQLHDTQTEFWMVEMLVGMGNLGLGRNCLGRGYEGRKERAKGIHIRTI